MKKKTLRHKNVWYVVFNLILPIALFGQLKESAEFIPCEDYCEGYQPIIDLDFRFYKERYVEENLLYKITDNWGNGCLPLYGTRNMRSVLHGVAYRGGANNYFHKTDKRKNHNPLPKDGINNLCYEGFSAAVYLYRTNFESVDSIDTCSCVHGANNQMKYYQLDYFDSSHVQKIIELVYESGIDASKGPVYLHCWNGWHASGFIAAVLLKQFCGYTSAEAIRYWDLGTDGANRSSRYQKIRMMIRDFEPNEKYRLLDKEGNYICPEMPQFIDSSKIQVTINHLLIVPESIAENSSIPLHNIYFKAGKSTIQNISKNSDIKTLLKALKTHKELVVEIGGYTDDIGNDSVNQVYSEQRARYVYDYLLSQEVDKNRLSYKGYGEQRPLYSNAYEATRVKNRRIEIKILQSVGLKEGD